MLAHLLTIFTLFLSTLLPHKLVIQHQVLASTITHQPTFAASSSPTPTVTITVFSTQTPTIISKPTVVIHQIPALDCVGPDGKHLPITKQQCIDFNNAWHHAQINSITPANTWGAATKIGDHTYSMQFTPDAQMANTSEILQALNNYRQKNGVGILVWNDKLTTYAQSRTDFYTHAGKLDEHAGFIDYVNNHDGFAQLGFNKIGENAALAGPLNGMHLIEGVFAGDTEHNTNQLNAAWTDVGIGVSGSYTDLIFAGEKR